MSMEMKRKLRKTLLLAFKIAVGSGAAIYIAEALHLEYAVSAGTVTLLALLATKWETIRFSFIRLGTFFVTGCLRGDRLCACLSVGSAGLEIDLVGQCCHHRPLYDKAGFQCGIFLE